MKRNEMLKMLIEAVADVNDEGHTTNKLIAEAVLNLVEEAGMLPPTCQILGYGDDVNMWEKE